MDPRPRWSASLVSTNVESSRKSIASPCTSSPVMLHTGHPLGVRRPPSRDERIDLCVRADRHDPAVRPDRCAGHEATQRRKRRDRQPLQWRGRDHRVAAPRVARHAIQLNNTATSLAHEVERAVLWRNVDRLHGVRLAGVPEAQRRGRGGADRTAPLAWWIGLGHGVNDYGSTGSLVIARVRYVEARAAPRRAWAKC